MLVQIRAYNEEKQFPLLLGESEINIMDQVFFHFLFKKGVI